MFQSAFPPANLHASCGFSTREPLTSPEIMCWSQNCNLSKSVNTAFSHTLALGNRNSTALLWARTLPNPRQPWALLPTTASQTYLWGHCSPKSWEVNFTVVFSSLSSRLVCAQTCIFLSLSPCCCNGILFKMKAFLCLDLGPSLSLGFQTYPHGPQQEPQSLQPQNTTVHP